MNLETTVKLTDTELLRLDGIERFAEIVEQAKRRIATVEQMAYTGLSEAENLFLARVVEHAKNTGEIGWRRCDMHRCTVCGVSKGYYKHARSNARRGIRKGDTDYNHPIYMAAYELAPTFVSMKGHVNLGCCLDCMEKLKSALQDALIAVDVALPRQLIKSGQFRKIKCANKRCTKCGWQGHEGELLRKQNYFDSGYHPDGCPNCKEGGRDIEKRDGFALVIFPLIAERRSPMMYDGRWIELSLESSQIRPVDRKYNGVDVVEFEEHGFQYRYTWRETE